MEEDKDRKHWTKTIIALLMSGVIIKLLITLFIIGAFILAFFLKDWFFKEEVTKKKMIQEITVITPPPPPPPPPEEPPPEPEVEEVIEEEVEEPTPEDTPDESISEDLGIDAEGEAGGDNFGLVGKKGGRGLLGGGGYGAYLKNEVNKAINRDKKLIRLAYKAKITIWIDDSGNFLRYEIEMLEGDQSTKIALEKFFSKMGGLDKAKPLEEDNKFTIRITSVI